MGAEETQEWREADITCGFYPGRELTSLPRADDATAGGSWGQRSRRWAGKKQRQAQETLACSAGETSAPHAAGKARSPGPTPAAGRTPRAACGSRRGQQSSTPDDLWAAWADIMQGWLPQHRKTQPRPEVTQISSNRTPVQKTAGRPCEGGTASQRERPTQKPLPAPPHMCFALPFKQIKTKISI